MVKNCGLQSPMAWVQILIPPGLTSLSLCFRQMKITIVLAPQVVKRMELLDVRLHSASGTPLLPSGNSRRARTSLCTWGLEQCLHRQVLFKQDFTDSSKPLSKADGVTIISQRRNLRINKIICPEPDCH